MKILKYCFDRIEIWVAQFFFLVMTAAVGFQLLSRYTGMGFFFTEELARYSYIWVVFACIALGENMRAHFNVTAFTMFLKGRAEQILELFIDVLSIILYTYLLYWSIRNLPFTHVIQTPAMRFPMTVITSSLCFCFFMCIVRRITHTINRVKLIKKGGDK